MFNLFAPHAAFFGQKDYQQTLVIRRMVEDLELPLRRCHLPDDAGTGRTGHEFPQAYLSPADRERATVLYRSLQLGKRLVAAGERDAASIRSQMHWLVDETQGVETKYLTLVDPETLQNAAVEQPVVALVAARVGPTHLIDNEILTPP